MSEPALKRKVLVVDDSLALSQALAAILGRHPGLQVVGIAADPYEAREKIIALQPDVLTLDVMMPRMDGLTFLTKLMKAHPMPVVMFSSLSQRGSSVAMKALTLGAVDVLGKPADPAKDLESMAQEIGDAVFAASMAKVQPRLMSALEHALKATARPSSRTLPELASSLIAIGASTGGTEALRFILKALPPQVPPILIVQHMLPGLMESFATSLNRTSGPRVKVAESGECPEPGWAYLAPSGQHLSLDRKGQRFSLRLLADEPVNRHRPSVDVLFQSLARSAGIDALGLILTGMGQDGAAGLLSMRQAGAATLGQDEASSVVYGMPCVAWERGAVQAQASLESLPSCILEWIGKIKMN